MSIANLEAPYIKMLVVDYAKDGNTVVVKKIPLQHIAGNLYRAHGEEYCKIYAMFTEHNIGIRLEYISEDTDPQLLLERSIAVGVNSFEQYVNMVQKRISNGSFIQYAQIRLFELTAPDLAASCVLARKEYDRRRQEAEREEKRIKDIEERSFVAENNLKAAEQLRKAINLICHGDCNIANEDVEIYKGRYSSKENTIINMLFRMYAPAPIKLQGWVNKSLRGVEISDSDILRYTYRGNKSKSICKYMRLLITAIKDDTELSVFRRWLNEHDIQLPLENDMAA